ncbi:hypothetical protein AWB71_03278 [Caballeronia peredens]|nr:hypothetical protein AWB71_03278 [Caballeronia peredens]
MSIVITIFIAWGIVAMPFLLFVRGAFVGNPA